MIRICCPAESYEFRGSIARARDTLTTLCLLLRIIRQVLRGKVDRSLPPTYTCAHTCARTRTRMCTIHRYERTFARGCIPPLSLSLSHFCSTFGPSSRASCTTNASDPVDDLVKVTTGKVVSQAVGELQNQEFLENCATGLSPHIGAGIRSAVRR